ncbi:MAG: acyltransferase family protein [Gammaproteobacteria bacterium]
MGVGMNSRTVQRDDIQGLRAVAVSGVVAFHLNKEWLPGGFAGVDAFLVISGFLITLILLRDRQFEPAALFAFYESRIKRIVPAYLALIAIVSVASAVLLTPGDFEMFNASVDAALHFESNSYFATQGDYFAPSAYEIPLLHTWSLAIEMQYYLGLPLLIAVLPERARVFVFAAIVVALLAGSSWEIHKGNRQAEYYSLLARIPEFLVGGLVAVLGTERFTSRGSVESLSIVGMVMVVGSFLLLSEAVAFPGASALLPCLGTALLILSRGSTLNKVLSTRPFVAVGALSYSIYLWHWPVLSLQRYLMESYTLNASGLVVFFVMMGVCSVFSYRYVELPFRKGRLSENYLPWVVAALVIGGALFIAPAINRGAVEPLDATVTRYADEGQICHGKILDDCVRGRPDGVTEVLLIGDSHAAQLNAFADVVGEETNTRLRVISASSCVPIPGFDIERISSQAQAACASQIEHLRNVEEAGKAVIIAGKWLYHASSGQFLRALDGYLAAAESRGQQVLVMEQVPMLNSDAIRRYRWKQVGIPVRELKVDEQWAASNEAIRGIVAKHSTVKFLQLSDLPLFSEALRDTGIPIYRDRHHLNEIGSRRLGEAASARVESWLVCGRRADCDDRQDD